MMMMSKYSSAVYSQLGCHCTSSTTLVPYLRYHILMPHLVTVRTSYRLLILIEPLHIEIISFKSKGRFLKMNRKDFLLLILMTTHVHSLIIILCKICSPNPTLSSHILYSCSKLSHQVIFQCFSSL